MYKILFLIIIFFIIFYIVNNKILVNKEHYLTFYLPFYNPNLNNITNFYLNDDNNKNYLKKKFNYDPLYITSTQSNSDFVKVILSNFISNSNLMNAKYIMNDNELESIENLNNNIINLSINNITNLNYYSQILNKDIDNIKLVTNLYKEYIYFITKNKYNVQFISNILLSFKIGIINNPDSMFFYYKILLKTLSLKENQDYHPVFYKNQKELFSAFVKDECNLIIFFDTFPSKSLSNLIDTNVGEQIILLPFKINNEDVFLKKNYFIQSDYIDLNKLSKSYLPKKFSDFTYTKFRPFFKCCYIKKILLTNNDANEKYVYNLIKFLYETYRELNIDHEEYKIDSIDIDTKTTQIIHYHPSVLKYFKEKGYITFNDNPNCGILTGKMECNNKNLANNNL